MIDGQSQAGMALGNPAEYAKRIAALQGGDVELSDINVDILDDDGKAMDLEEVIEGVEVEPEQRKAA